MRLALAALAFLLSVTLVGGSAAHAATQHYTVDTGWVRGFDGDCKATAHVDYYPDSDSAHIETTVGDPYHFRACRVHTTVYVQTPSQALQGAVHYAMACALWDPTCPSTKLTVGDYVQATPMLQDILRTVNSYMPPGYPPVKGSAVVTGIRVVFTKA